MLSFTNPPIQEVSYSLQYEPNSALHIGYLGLLWDQFRRKFPRMEHLPRLSHEIERFGVPTPKPLIQLIDEREPPRVLMVSEENERLLQVQNDRFVFNWRRHHNQGLEYPRYTNLKKEYQEAFETFVHFFNENGLGEIKVDQVEITNINHIDASSNNLEDIFNGLNCGVELSGDLELESYGFNMKHVLRHDDKPIGRLHTIVNRAIKDDAPIFSVTFVARSHLFQSDGANQADIFNIMDMLRNNINLAFKKLTSDKMHSVWGLVEEDHE